MKIGYSIWMGYGEFWSGHGMTGRTVSYGLESSINFSQVKWYFTRCVSGCWPRLHIVDVFLLLITFSRRLRTRHSPANDVVDRTRVINTFVFSKEKTSRQTFVIHKYLFVSVKAVIDHKILSTTDVSDEFDLKLSVTERSCTQHFFKVQYVIIQTILSRKSMKKFAVTDEKIFHAYKDFDRKKMTVMRIWGLPTHSLWKRLSAWTGRLQI